MMLGRLEQPWGGLVALAIGVVVFGALGVLILKAYRRFAGAAARAQARAYAGVTVFPGPAPGAVGVVFHVYSGVLVFVSRAEHRFWAAPDDARLVLRRLHGLNLTWGLLAYGGLVIPVLSYGNYLAQRRRIARQAAGHRAAKRAEVVAGGGEPATGVLPPRNTS